jgi:hypothetical protein
MKLLFIKIISVVILLFISFFTASDVNAATASILIGGRSDISIGTGAIIPSIVWSGTGGKTTGGYVTTISVNSTTLCSGVPVGTWSGRGNTASGTYWPHPATAANTAAPANRQGCVITYTYTVTPTTGSPVTSVAIIRYVAPVTPTASISTSLSVDNTVLVGENKPTIYWSSSNGASYITTITRTGSCTSGMPASVIWTSGITSSGNAPSYVHPTTNTSPTISTNMSGCDLTYTYEVTSSTGNKTTGTAIVRHRGGSRPTASITFKRSGETQIHQVINVGIGALTPTIDWSSSGGATYSTNVSVNNSSLCPGVVTGTWSGRGNTASGTYFPHPATTNTYVVAANLLGCQIIYTYRVTNSVGASTLSSATINYVQPAVATASISTNLFDKNLLGDDVVIVGERVPKITWSSSNGVSYRTTIQSQSQAGACPFTNSFTWTKGNTAAGTAYGYPTTNEVPILVPSNMAGSTGCRIRYNFIVRSSTGNDYISSVNVEHVPSSMVRPPITVTSYGSQVTDDDGIKHYYATTTPLTNVGVFSARSVTPVELYNYQTNIKINDPALCPGIPTGLWNRGNKWTNYESLWPYRPDREGCDVTLTYEVTRIVNGLTNAIRSTFKYRNPSLVKNLSQYSATNFGSASIVYPNYLINESTKPYVNALWSGVNISKYQYGPYEPEAVYVNITPSTKLSTEDWSLTNAYNSFTGEGYYTGMGPNGLVNPQGLNIYYAPVAFNGGQIPSQYTLEQNDDDAYENFWSQDGNNKGKKAEIYVDYDSTGPFFQGSFLHGGYDGGSYPLYMYMKYPDPLYSNGGVYGAPKFGYEPGGLGCIQGVDSNNCSNINAGPQVLIRDNVVIDDPLVPSTDAYCYASTDNGLTQVSGVLPNQAVTWHLSAGDANPSQYYYRWVGDDGINPVPTRTNFTNIPPQISTPVTNPNTLCSYIAPLTDAGSGGELQYGLLGPDQGAYKYNSSLDKCCTQIFTCNDEDCLDVISVNHCRDVPDLYANTWSNIPKLTTSYSGGGAVDMELQYAVISSGSDYMYPASLRFPAEEEEWNYLQCRPLSAGQDICPNIIGTQVTPPPGFSMAPSDAVIASGLATIEDRRCFPTSLAIIDSGIDLRGDPTRINPGGNVKWTFNVDDSFFQGMLDGVLYSIPRFATITWSGDINENDPYDIDEYSEFVNGGFFGDTNDKNVIYTQDETTPTVSVTIEDEFGSWTDTASVTVGGECVGAGCLTPCPVGGPIPCSTNNVPGDEAQISNFTINPSVANENNQCTLSWTTGLFTNTCEIKGPTGDIPVATSTSPQSINVNPGTYTLSCLNHAPEVTAVGPRTCLQNPDLREN